MPNLPAPELPPFQHRQRAFAAHIRDPLAYPRPGDVPERRMRVYRELFFNNVEGLLASAFPVLRRLLTQAAWLGLVRDFFAAHRCRTPLFLEIGREFVQYLEAERTPAPGDPPFLAELAHYEWVELALAVSDADRDAPNADPDGDLLAGHPLLSPLAWPLRYRFAVHRIGPDVRPAAPGACPTCLMVYRDQRDQVRFFEISAVTHALLELLRAEPALSGRAALVRIAEALAHPDPAAIIDFGLALLVDLRSRGLILGTRRDG